MPCTNGTKHDVSAPFSQQVGVTNTTATTFAGASRMRRPRASSSASSNDVRRDAAHQSASFLFDQSRYAPNTTRIVPPIKATPKILVSQKSSSTTKYRPATSITIELINMLTLLMRSFRHNVPAPTAGLNVRRLQLAWCATLIPSSGRGSSPRRKGLSPLKVWY